MSPIILPTNESRSSAPLVFLPGWAFDGRVLQLRRDLDCPAPPGLLDPPVLFADFGAWLDRQAIERCQLLGWSLGGLCALELARRYPGRVEALHLLAVRAAWPADELAAIRRELEGQPEDFLRSFYRKCFLGYRESYRRFQRELEADYLAQALQAPELLLRGLDFLAAPGGKLPPPAAGRVYCLHGRRDLIAPPAQRLLVAGADCHLLEQGGHALFLDYPPPSPPGEPAAVSRPERLPAGKKAAGFAPAVALQGVGEADVPARPREPGPAAVGPEKGANMLRRRFSRAAATYDRNADVQRQTLALLAERLPPDPEARLILELGCGTGNLTGLLLEHFPRARLLSLDFSEAMLKQAREKIRVADNLQAGRVSWLCQDGESFLAANRTCFDYVTANAALQWFGDLPAAFARIRAGLRPGGRLLTTIFGRRSLVELEEGLAAVMEGRMHVAARRFPDYPELTALLRVVFPEVEISEHRLSRQFGDLGELLRHFRYTGTGGPGTAAGFNPSHYRRLSRWFQERHGGFRVSFQVFVVSCGSGRGEAVCPAEPSGQSGFMAGS